MAPPRDLPGALAALLPTRALCSRSYVAVSTIRYSSSRSFLIWASSSRSRSIARLSFSTPSRVRTRTSMIVPLTPVGTPQRGVLHVRRLLAEDGAQELLFRSELGFALGRHLADEHVAGNHFGPDVDNARLVKLAERRLANVRYVGGDLFRSKLGIPCDARQLLDVHAGEAILLHHPLGDEYRVLEVVAVPRHERDTHVLAQGQFALIDGWSIGKDVAPSL